MENKSQLRTLYLIQVITLVLLILHLITLILPFLGISANPLNRPQNLPPGIYQKSGYVSPSNGSQAGAAQTFLIIPPLVL